MCPSTQDLGFCLSPLSLVMSSSMACTQFPPTIPVLMTSLLLDWHFQSLFCPGNGDMAYASSCLSTFSYKNALQVITVGMPTFEHSAHSWISLYFLPCCSGWCFSMNSFWIWAWGCGIAPFPSAEPDLGWSMCLPSPSCLSLGSSLIQNVVLPLYLRNCYDTGV